MELLAGAAKELLKPAYSIGPDLEARLLRATDGEYDLPGRGASGDADWAAVMDCCDRVNALASAHQRGEVVDVLRRRLRQATQPATRRKTLTLLDALCKNCGLPFLRAVGGCRPLLDALAAAAASTAGSTARDDALLNSQVLELVQGWGEDLLPHRATDPGLGALVELYFSMRKDTQHHYAFPRQLDDSRVPTLTPPVHLPPELQTATSAGAGARAVAGAPLPPPRRSRAEHGGATSATGGSGGSGGAGLVAQLDAAATALEDALRACGGRRAALSTSTVAAGAARTLREGAPRLQALVDEALTRGSGGSSGGAHTVEALLALHDRLQAAVDLYADVLCGKAANGGGASGGGGGSGAAPSSGQPPPARHRGGRKHSSELFHAAGDAAAGEHTRHGAPQCCSVACSAGEHATTAAASLHGAPQRVRSSRSEAESTGLTDGGEGHHGGGDGYGTIDTGDLLGLGGCGAGGDGGSGSGAVRSAAAAAAAPLPKKQVQKPPQAAKPAAVAGGSSMWQPAARSTRADDTTAAAAAATSATPSGSDDFDPFGSGSAGLSAPAAAISSNTGGAATTAKVPTLRPPRAGGAPPAPATSAPPPARVAAPAAGGDVDLLGGLFGGIGGGGSGGGGVPPTAPAAYGTTTTGAGILSHYAHQQSPQQAAATSAPLFDPFAPTPAPTPALAASVPTSWTQPQLSRQPPPPSAASGSADPFASLVTSFGGALQLGGGGSTGSAGATGTPATTAAATFKNNPFA